MLVILTPCICVYRSQAAELVDLQEQLKLYQARILQLSSSGHITVDPDNGGRIAIGVSSPGQESSNWPFAGPLTLCLLN